uniref:UBA domain-containing protein n=1 Tax=Anopheles funestus TaxID=62324 RepID=A0A182RVM7_ANOFN
MVVDQQGEKQMQSNENDTVNMKCDLSHYLIAVNKTKLSVISEATDKMMMPEMEAQQLGDDQIIAIKNSIREPPLKHKDNNANVTVTTVSEQQLKQSSSSNSSSSRINEKDQYQQSAQREEVSSTNFVRFAELLRLTQLESTIRQQAPHYIRLRLLGGGEDSINNGTSAWGTPAATNNPTGSTWGPIGGGGGGGGSAQQSNSAVGAPGGPQQQGTGALPPTTGAWGGAGQQNGGGPGGQTSKNNAASSVNPNSVGASGVAPDGSGSSGGNGGNAGAAGGPWNGPGGNAQASSAAQGAPVVVGAAGNGNNAVGVGGPQQDQAGVAAGVSQQQQQQVGGTAAAQQQAAGQAGQPEAGSGGASAAAGVGAAGAVVQSSAAKNQLEHLNSLRESLFAQDGWGSENVDQDTLWEVPVSPEPGGKTDPNSATSGPMAGIPMWKTNTGTELWEANLRNGGQLPQQQPPAQKTPWGPANNYGGTWGEDDEANEPATGWNGSMGAAGVAGGPGGPGVGMRDQPPGPQQSQQLAGQQQAQQPPWNTGGVAGAGVGAGAGGMWSGGNGGGAPGGVGAMTPNVAAGLKKDNDWGSAIGAGGGAAAGGNGAWGATGGGGGVGGGAADGRVGGNPVAALDPTGLDMRNIRIASAMDSNREIRGDPRGISGRLNGNVGLWDQHQMSSMQQKMPPTATTPGTPTGGVGGQGGGNQWPSNNPLGSVNNGVAGGVGGGAKLVAGSGWDDPNAGGGPPVVGGVRRNNMDDGTALWGQNALNRQNSGNVSGWNDNSGGGLGPPGADGGMGRNLMHRNAMVGGGGGNLPGNGGLVGRGVGPGGPMKPDSLWGQNPAAALGAGPRGGAGNWGADDVPSGAGGSNWGDEKPPGSGMGGNSLWNDGNNWNNKGKMSSAGGWNDGTPGGAGSGPGGMDMGNSDWGMPPQSKLPPNGNKINALEIIRCSKPYRQLCEMGFKKEDVEGVLRLTNMNVEESLELLHRSSGGGGSDWSRRPDGGHGGFGAGDQFVGGGGVSGRFAAAAAGVGPMAFPQNNQNLGGGVFGGGNGSAAGGGSFNSMKFGGGAGHGGAGGNGGGPVGGGGGGPPGAGAGVFGGQQQQQQQQQQQPGALGGGGLNQSNAQSQQISNHHLRLLVQQIQLAVQNGYLENQILNQPLAPQTLMLLNQLLTHIKQLNVMQNNLSRTGGGGGVNAVQMSIAINKLKSQIASLQNQINMQQANYLKQQQQQQHQQQQHQQQPPHPGSLNAANVNVSAIAAGGGGGNHPGNDLFRGPSDLAGLPGSFADMALKDSGGVPFPSTGNTSQQSRLQKWKLPPNSATATGLDKDGSDLTDFVRAPGASSKSGPSGSGIDDGTWSNGRNNLGDGWPDSSSQDNKEWPGANDAFSDLVPEFEPGKPWKGTQATRIEDDPTITPGSVARNPLSIAAAKESNLFGGGSTGGATNSKSSPTESPWSFNPSSGGVQGANYGGKVQKNPWQDPNTPTMPPADLWETPLGGGGGGNGAKGRGVGMMGGIGKAGGGKMDTNGWNTPSTQAGGSNTWNSAGPSANSWSSTWIMLKNLTAQIEGSTLRTLCLQHGPVLNFHLYLNHGIALCKYGTREEAQKAQLALNNCQLGNTTICAEIPNESDIQYILPHLVGNSNGMANGLTSGGGQNWRLSAAAQSQPMVGRSNSVVQDTWSSNSWGTGNTSSNLWNTLDGGPGDRGTPANLNSLLPESLLGTELN